LQSPFVFDFFCKTERKDLCVFLEKRSKTLQRHTTRKKRAMVSVFYFGVFYFGVFGVFLTLSKNKYKKQKKTQALCCGFTRYCIYKINTIPCK